jgi:pyruvate dehydrogenase E2 component (dihydrolipoamide acetyltransferase)
MPENFLLPDLGEGLADAELLRWLVAVGDTVSLNQPIVEVETAKATVELPSPFAGQVIALLAEAGSTVDVGTPIITINPSPPSRDHANFRTTEPPDLATPERIPVLVGYGATSGTTSRRNARPHRAAPTTPAEPVIPSQGAPGQTALGRPLAKPLVRKLARELNVDLATITGTGTDGVITRQDVLDHSETPAPAPDAPASLSQREPAREEREEREERIPIRGVRKATAAAMVRSAFTAPHVTEFVTIDVSATRDLLDRLRASAFTGQVRLTMTAFAAYALLQALRRHPELNSAWDEVTQEIVLKRYVNLGIATASPRGLLVPNLKDADRLSLIELAGALERLTVTARNGQATTADLTGGTFTLTNVGMFGVDSGTPIINPGEAAILCLGAVRQQPWVHEGELAVRWVTTLSLSFDHRLVDGEQGSRFLADVAELLTAG